MRLPKEDVLTIGNIYENGDTTYKAHQTTTTNVVCSEEELKKENERAFIKSCLACMSAEDIVKMLVELEIEDEIYNEIDYYDEYGYAD